jgi:hypothetical protein
MHVIGGSFYSRKFVKISTKNVKVRFCGYWVETIGDHPANFIFGKQERE